LDHRSDEFFKTRYSLAETYGVSKDGKLMGKKKSKYPVPKIANLKYYLNKV
jgi:hypothetical protein